MSEKTTKAEKAVTTDTKKSNVNAQAFIERKLKVLNNKSGAVASKNASRVVENNKGGKG